MQASPWPGAEAIWRAAGGSFERIALAAVPAVVGRTLDDLSAGPASRWDYANGVRVQLAAGALSSADDLRIFGGANVAALRRADGAWEIFQFGAAELVAENTYRLSRLLRGQLGTEWAMGDPLPAGAPFVLLDASLVAVARGTDLLGRSFDYRVGAASLDIGSANMTNLSASIGPVALMPWSPVHLRGARTDDGILLSWIRRTRKGGDSWDTVEVPLGEASEAYRVEILSGASVVRALESAVPQVLYESADELADFGAAQTALGIRVAQLSALVGAGRTQSANIIL